MTLHNKRTGIAALIIIDVQEAFLETLPNPSAFLRRCCFACKAASLLEIPIVITEQAPEKLGYCHPAIIDSAPVAKVFPKETFSAMKLVELIQHLEESNVEHLIMAGLETPICVYQSAIEALRLNFNVTLLTDCISGRRPEDASTVLNYLGRESNCHLLPSESVFYSLLEDAHHPKFKDFTNLVKVFHSPGLEESS